MKEKKLSEYSDSQIIKGYEKLTQESAPEPGDNISDRQLTPREKQFIQKIKTRNDKDGHKQPL